MTVRARLALLSPVWALAVRKSHEAARLAATVRTLEHDLAVVTAERDALRAKRPRPQDQVRPSRREGGGVSTDSYTEFLRAKFDFHHDTWAVVVEMLRAQEVAA